MAKLKAKRTGTKVFLPKYQNAEMLTLEFFKGDTFAITSWPATDDYTVIQIHQHVDILDQLIKYVNANI